MKKNFKLAVFVTPLLAAGITLNAQVTRTRSAAVTTNPIPTVPAGISQFQIEGLLLTQNSFINPTAASGQQTGNFGVPARWNSMGNLNAGSQTLNGFRTQTSGRALVSGHSIANAGGVLSNPFIQWIGNATAGVTPGTLEFKFAVNPGGVGAPAPDVTLFSMAPTAAGTGGDSYAQNGILGHLNNGTFGDITGPAQWLGHGPARIAGVLDPTIYGTRIQQGQQSMLFNLVSGKPVVGWGDQGQDMVFRYFPNKFNSALFTDVLSLQSTGRSNFGPAFTPDAKVSIRGEEPTGLDILVKNNGSAAEIGGNALVLTATRQATGFFGQAQSDAPTDPTLKPIRNIGVRGQAGITGGIATDGSNFGVYGEANPNTSTSNNYGVFGTCPASTVANFTAGGYFTGGLFCDVFTIISDQSLKTNVKAEGDITSKIMQLRPVNYMLDQNRRGYNFTGKLQHGFIAQEMEKVFPELVNDIKHPVQEGDKTTFEAIKGVNYVGLISVLTRGMQEQTATIAAQEEKINTLEKEMQAMKQTLQALAASAKVSPAAGAELAAGYELKQNVPNPFNENTVIYYTVPAGDNNATLGVFDLNGRMIASFPNLKGKGQVTINGGRLEAGIYLYSLLSAGQEILSRRMVVTK